MKIFNKGDNVWCYEENTECIIPATYIEQCGNNHNVLTSNRVIVEMTDSEINYTEKQAAIKCLRYLKKKRKTINKTIEKLRKSLDKEEGVNHDKRHT